MKRIFCLVLALALTALATSQCWSIGAAPAAPSGSAEAAHPPLNSERIRQKFGSYGIDVLQDDGKLRISSLYTTEGDQKVTRTLAVVVYAGNIPQQVLREHRAILAGASIGETFTQAGWRVEKKNLYFGEIGASPDLYKIYSLMGGIAETDLAVHVYRLSVCRDEFCFAYATLSEVHHPDYLSLAELREIYDASSELPPQGTDQDRDVDPDIQETLDLTVAALAAQ